MGPSELPDAVVWKNFSLAYWRRKLQNWVMRKIFLKNQSSQLARGCKCTRVVFKNERYLTHPILYYKALNNCDSRLCLVKKELVPDSSLKYSWSNYWSWYNYILVTYLSESSPMIPLCMWMESKEICCFGVLVFFFYLFAHFFRREKWSMWCGKERRCSKN